MSKQEVLKQAIQKAIDNGWKLENVKHTYVIDDTGMFVTSFVDGEIYEEYQINTILFSHAFAKAIFGEDLIKHRSHQIIKQGKKVGESYGMWPKWKTHVQEMAIAEDPITYLGANI